MLKKIEFNTTEEKFDEIRQNTSKVSKWLIKTETNGKDSIDDTPYAALADEKKKADCSLVALAAVNNVAYCQLHDEYYEAYYEKNPDVKRTEPMLRKKIAKSCFPRLKKGTPNVKDFQVRISEKMFNRYVLQTLLALYPEANNVAEALKMLFTEIELIANDSKMNSYTSSAGGKFSALCHFNFGIFGKKTVVKLLKEGGTISNLVDLSTIKCTTLVEPFARTMAISLHYFYCFDRIYCGDTDYRFVNYMEVVDKWCDEMVESIKEQFKDLSAASDIQKKYDELKKISKLAHSKSRKETKVKAAAALYILINISFSGNEKNAVSTRMADFEQKLDKRVHNLRYLSANMPKIEYVHSDFRKTIKKFLNEPSALLILDPPYLKEFGLPCKDYPDEFTYKDMIYMFKLLKNAKCKVILFHSRSYWFDSTAVSYGFHKVGYYVGRNIGKEYKPYYTEVYSLNIDPSVKFFDPKNHGESY